MSVKEMMSLLMEFSKEKNLLTMVVKQKIVIESL